MNQIIIALCWDSLCVGLTSNPYALSWKEGNVFRDEGVIERIEVEWEGCIPYTVWTFHRTTPDLPYRKAGVSIARVGRI